jgi:hypothetical protein
MEEKVYVLQISTETSDCPEYFNCFGVFKTYKGAEEEALRLIKSWDPEYEISPNDDTEYGYVDINNNCDRVGEISISAMTIKE